MKKNSLALSSFLNQSTKISSKSTASATPPKKSRIISTSTSTYSPRHQLYSPHSQLYLQPVNNNNNNSVVESVSVCAKDNNNNARRCSPWSGGQNRGQTQHHQGGEICNSKISSLFQFFHFRRLNLSNFGFGLKRRSMSVYSPIGSPPSPYGSPTAATMNSTLAEVGGHDDIVALSSGFDRRRRTLRRRLSTINDSPPPEEEKDSNGMPLAPLRGVVEQDEGEGADEAEAAEAGADLFVKAQKFESVLNQLEKVIQYKGRNVSHIIVEKAVKELCNDYDFLDESEKLKFFNLIAERYSVDHQNIAKIASSLADCKDENTSLTIQEKLRAALVPQYQWLFSQIGRLEGGVKFLVDLRTDLLEIPLKYPDEGSFHLKSMNNSLKDLIAMWFAVGFLNLERVTWKSPCDMLQKISEYEAVHPMRNWTDLKRRVGPYRRCFVFTHGSMPLEPVVVLHTALTDHIPSNIGTIVTASRMRMSLDGSADMGNGVTEDPDHITTAIFYSITSTQKGLAGIELGNYLIKQVVKELQKEFPKMSMFSSLSPIPGFRAWLLGEIKLAIKGTNDSSQFLFNPQELKAIAESLGLGLPLPLNPQDEFESQVQIFRKLLQLISDNEWVENDRLFNELENPLMRLCARYLVLTRRRGFALDPVANFHLKNGAVIWRLNWRGNLKIKGLKESCGIMVNYRYFLEECESNSQNYMESQEIKLGDQVRHLVKLAKNEGSPSPPGSPSKL